MYCYTGILLVVKCKGWVSYASLFVGNKLIWECCISYSTLIGVVFGVPLNHRRVVSTAEMDVDFVMISISSIIASNC